MFLFFFNLLQIVDKTILFHDKDNNGKINFEEFCEVLEYLCSEYFTATSKWVREREIEREREREQDSARKSKRERKRAQESERE